MNKLSKKLWMMMVAVVLSCQLSFASDYSYIFIQGDKQTPFYVKLEGQMMPRLGKNYCILPNLDKGTIHLEILFQQNIYPAQKFTIKVPAAGGRGFTLQQLNDKQFALYDLASHHKLIAGNKESDDVLEIPAAAVDDNALAWGNTTAEDLKAPVTRESAPVVREESLPAFNSKKPKEKKAAKVKEEKIEEPPTERNRFIDDIELNKEGSSVPPFNAGAAATPAPVREEKPAKKKKDKAPVIVDDNEDLYEGSTVFTERAAAAKAKKEEVKSVEESGIPNSDCPAAMSNDEFEEFAIKIMDKTDDDAQLKYLRKTASKSCFTTEQVRILAKNMETQSGRFETVKLLYPRVIDQGNYTVLESLFNTSYLKGKFKELTGTN